MTTLRDIQMTCHKFDTKVFKDVTKKRSSVKTGLEVSIFNEWHNLRFIEMTKTRYNCQIFFMKL